MRNLERLRKLSRMTPLRRGGAGTQVKFHWPADLCPTYDHRAGPKQVEGLGYDEWWGQRKTKLPLVPLIHKVVSSSHRTRT